MLRRKTSTPKKSLATQMGRHDKRKVRKRWQNSSSENQYQQHNLQEIKSVLKLIHQQMPLCGLINFMESINHYLTKQK